MHDIAQLITLFMGISGAVYGVMVIVMKPNTDKIEALIKQNDNIQKKLEGFIEQYADIKSNLDLNKQQHKDLFDRIQKIEDDLSKLRDMIYEMKGEDK